MNNNFYICDKYYLLLFPTKELATKSKTQPLLKENFYSVQEAEFSARVWSKHFGSKVVFTSPKEPIFVIEKCDNIWNVLIGEKTGWITAEKWLEIKPLVLENDNDN